MSRREPYVFRAPASDAKPVWRSLDEKRNPEQAAERATSEFPTGVVDESLIDSSTLLGRRSFIAVGGAGAALALSGCDALRRPEENILPFSKGPEYVIPGIPLHFATTVERAGEAFGVLATTHEGRPTKLEGNLLHPASRGATDTWVQAEIMSLYDPDRSRKPARREGEALVDASFAEFDAAVSRLLEKHQTDGGAGLRVLSGPTTSPSVMRVREALFAKLANAKLHVYAPVTARNQLEGTRIAYGQPLSVRPAFAAKVILGLDSDFLGTEEGSVRATREFTEARRLESAADVENMPRFYAVEANFSVTGSNADHRLRLPASEVDRYLRALCRTLVTTHGVDLGPVGAALGTPSTEGIPEKWLSAVARDLYDHRGSSVVVAGPGQPPRVHALVAALNHALGGTDRTVVYDAPIDPAFADPVADLRSLVDAMNGGGVETLLILGGNPVYDAPADLGFAAALAKVETAIHVALHRDETSVYCAWHVPRAHALETWGDHRAHEGTLSVQQPLIAPIWGARSELEVLGQFAGEPNWRGHAQVRKTLRSTLGDVGFERVWRRALRQGTVAGTSRATTVPALRPDAVAESLAGGPSAAGTYGPDSLEVRFVPDNRLYDGRYGNNLWLLELPEQMTKLAWDNAAHVSPSTARALGVDDGDVVSLSRPGAKDLEVAVKVLPGHADGSVTLTLGWGRSRAGRWGNGQGFDVYPFRTSDGFDVVTGVKATKTGRTYWLAQTQEHHSMEGRPLAIQLTASEYRAKPDAPSYRTVEMTVPPLWEQVEYNGYKWGMTIDLATCTGCNACVVACQAENNIPSVGKRELARGREMYWIRIDRYFVGDEDEPELAMQPVGCQHCEEAPCENVCPVNATVHSPEGMNDMAYNRCIGTRYCMNNCPYKVRRFNYFNWHGSDVPETKKMQFNPNVTVRMRGVMEKCSYCVQRVEEAKYAAKVDGRRRVRDGEIVTACQQACPAGAIVFGDLNDESSRVHRLAQTDRRYKLLAEIGTQPRTTFLAHVRNANPEMEA